MVTTVTNEVFEDIKQAAISLWNTYDDTYGYATEKISRIKDLENLPSELEEVFLPNWGYIIAMFDIGNQHALLAHLKTKEAYEFYEDYLFEMMRELNNRN